MKKCLTTTLLLALSPAILAQQLSPQNVIQRPLTNKVSEVQLGGSLSFNDGTEDNDINIGIAASYGITDNVTLGLDGIRYRFIQRDDRATGFEAAIGAGLRDYYDSGENEALAYGTDITGKYVFSPDLAVYFGASYVFWNEKFQDNREEFRYTLGVQKNLFSDLTLSVGYTYRDLRDNFAQDNANAYHASLNYALTDQWDLGLFATYTDFDANENNFDEDDFARRRAGLYASYRF